MTTAPDSSTEEARQSFFAKQQLIDGARSVFQLISAMLKNSTLYPGSHPILLTTADKLKNKIEELLVGRPEVGFYLAGGELFFEKLSVPVDQSVALVIEQFSARNVGGIIFKPGLPAEELIRLSGLMNNDKSSFSNDDTISAAMFGTGITHIELHSAIIVGKSTAETLREEKHKASEVFQEAIGAVKAIVQSAQQDKIPNMRKTNTVVQGMVDNILQNSDVFLGLTHIKMYDEYTFAHSVNVSILAISLGAFLSFQKTQLAALGIAGMMHDIGKMQVPHEIINKPGKLTNEEWEAVKRHPVEGALLLARTPNVSKLGMVVAFQHHQHSSAGGYPAKEGEHRQHPFSQIVALADAYDAITAARVYYSAQTSPDQGVRILLKKRGNPFNPVLVDAFVSMIGLFPIGSVVKLDTGEIGLVTRQTRDLMRPYVLVLTRFDGSEKESGTPVSMLETENGRYKRSIVGTINPSLARFNVKQYFD